MVSVRASGATHIHRSNAGPCLRGSCIHDLLQPLGAAMGRRYIASPLWVICGTNRAPVVRHLKAPFRGRDRLGMRCARAIRIHGSARKGAAEHRYWPRRRVLHIASRKLQPVAGLKVAARHVLGQSTQCIPFQGPCGRCRATRAGQC